jgi:hypothetical protein
MNPDNEEAQASFADEGRKTTANRDSRMEHFRRLIEALKEKTAPDKD